AGSFQRLLERSCDRSALRDLDPVTVGIAYHRNPRGGSKRNRLNGLATAVRNYTRVFGIDLEHLEGDVAPALAIHCRITRRVGGLFQNEKRFAGAKGRAAGMFLLSKPKRVCIEQAMRREVPDLQPDADLRDAVMARRNERHGIAVRVPEASRRLQSI